MANQQPPRTYQSGGNQPNGNTEPPKTYPANGYQQPNNYQQSNGFRQPYQQQNGYQQPNNYQQNGYQQPVNYQQQDYSAQVQAALLQEKKAKKKKRRKIILIVLGILLALGIISAITSGGDDSSTDTTASDDTSVVAAEDKTESKEEKTEATTEETTISESDYKAKCGTIDYKELARMPDSYEGNYYKFTGEVIQVQESTFLGVTSYEYRVSVTKNEYGYTADDIIYVTYDLPEGSPRILEDDIVTLYGQSEGLYTYTSITGASISIPQIDAAYIDIN